MLSTGACYSTETTKSTPKRCVRVTDDCLRGIDTNLALWLLLVMCSGRICKNHVPPLLPPRYFLLSQPPAKAVVVSMKVYERPSRIETTASS